MTGTKIAATMGTGAMIAVTEETGAMTVETGAMIAVTEETIKQKRGPFSTRMNDKASSTLAFFLCAL